MMSIPALAPYTAAVRQAVQQQNWVAALALALTLPDICGGLETPGQWNSKARSARWFDAEMGRHYMRLMPPDTHASELPEAPEPPENMTRDTDAYNRHTAARAAWRAKVRALIDRPLGEKVSLSGLDCYALRCAYLHEGSDHTDRHTAREALDRFQFVACQGNNLLHNNVAGRHLQLDVATFCGQMADAVDAWGARVGGEPGIQAEAARLATITVL